MQKEKSMTQTQPTDWAVLYSAHCWKSSIETHTCNFFFRHLSLFLLSRFAQYFLEVGPSSSQARCLSSHYSDLKRIDSYKVSSLRTAKEKKRLAKMHISSALRWPNNHSNWSYGTSYFFLSCVFFIELFQGSLLSLTHTLPFFVASAHTFTRNCIQKAFGPSRRASWYSRREVKKNKKWSVCNKSYQKEEGWIWDRCFHQKWHQFPI